MYTEPFPNDSGVEITLKRPNRFEYLKFEMSLFENQPKPPEKTAETAFGEEGVPDKDDLAYKLVLAEWQLATNLTMTDFMLLEYVLLEVPTHCPDLEQTYRRMEKRGGKPPYDLKDPDERKVAYIRHLLGNGITPLLGRLSELKGASEEEIRALEASFRGDVGRKTLDGRTGRAVPGAGSADPVEPVAGMDGSGSGGGV